MVNALTDFHPIRDRPYRVLMSLNPSDAGSRDLRLLQAATKMLQLDKMRFCPLVLIVSNVEKKFFFVIRDSLSLEASQITL